jgi:hypothetical protein
MGNTRTYAARMEGALETDIALIQAAMNRDGPTIERVSNTQLELTVNAPTVAGLGTRLATRCGALATQVPEEEEKLSGGEGGIRTRTGRSKSGC